MLRLRALEEADLAAVLPMVRAYYAEDGLDYREHRQPAALALIARGDPSAHGWVIELGPASAGYVVLCLTFSVEAGGREACIDEFYVRPELRRRGVGSGVLALLEVEARALGARRLYLEVTRGNRALGLYRRAGYRDHDRFLVSKFL